MMCKIPNYPIYSAWSNFLCFLERLVLLKLVRKTLKSVLFEQKSLLAQIFNECLNGYSLLFNKQLVSSNLITKFRS